MSELELPPTQEHIGHEEGNSVAVGNGESAEGAESLENPGIVDDDDDEEFDDFGEAVQPEVVEQPDNQSDHDDEFGSFDNGGDIKFDESIMNDEHAFSEKLDQVMDQMFSIDSNAGHEHKYNDSTTATAASDDTGLTIDKLLNERSNQVLQQLATLPHLKPNNWIKLRIRHNLLINLGIPINLDEISQEPPMTLNHNHKIHSSHNRRRSINEEDINWQEFQIPEFKDLNISNEQKDLLISRTNEILSNIETDNLNNSSKSFLDSSDEVKLKEKLMQFQHNYNQLVELSSVWKYHFNDLKANFEIYESVVQNLIGYSQKQERDQLLQNLKQLKDKSKRKKSLWRK